ncbi:uncharacterized protein LOC131211471 [Anopheles bellator]|uniref:uncharacterized protein LOC131211471 n=1 Tax=Anopheles bellator TaxID=139047 RepID=UPI00264905DC|nr:uncharacterized protein LOC131211471 [Anopheles bellator]
MKLLGVHVISADSHTAKEGAAVQWFWIVLLTLLRIYFIFVTLRTDAWGLIHISSSGLVEQSMAILMQLPFFALLLTPWLFQAHKVRILRMFSDLERFDAEIAKLCCCRNYQVHHLLGSLSTVMCCIFHPIFLAGIRGVEFWSDHFMAGAFMSYCWSGGICFYMMFNLLLYFVWTRAETINHVLKKLTYRIDSECDVQETLRLIRTLRKLQDKLCDVTHDCSVSYGTPMVMLMIHILVSLLVATFAFLRVVFYRYIAAEAYDAAFYMVGTVLYSALSIMSIALAGELRKCSINTWKLVHRLINLTTSAEIEDELQWLSEQMSHRLPSIDLLFFDVDWLLLVRATGELATYLIIMIQFDAIQ